MNVNCNRDCAPSSRTLHPEAEHYLDCPIWQAALRHPGSDMARSIDTQHPATDAARHRRQPADDGAGVVVWIVYSILLAAVFVVLAALYFGWWK